MQINSWNTATLFLDGTHIRIKWDKQYDNPPWNGVSFHSYKLKKTAVSVVVSIYCYPLILCEFNYIFLITRQL